MSIIIKKKSLEDITYNWIVSLTQRSLIIILIKKKAFAILYSSKSFNYALATNAASIHTAHICLGHKLYSCWSISASYNLQSYSNLVAPN